jgi:hypothetical protein
MKIRDAKGEADGNQDGFIALIVFFIIALALLKYFFDWSVFEASSTPQGQETVSYTKRVLDTIWYYLQAPIAWIWSQIIWPIFGFIWKGIQALITSSN